ncbi:MAG: 3'-5' exonuclease, partial [Casimicrobiaceae bacterium]
GSAEPVFIVGDPKQSIYGFRNADLHAYFEAGARAASHYTLLENQRATRELIAAQNALFGANRAAFAQDELVYRPVHAGARVREALVDPAPCAPLTVWSLPGGDDGGTLLRADAHAAAIRASAAEIARLLGDAKANRARLGDRALDAADIAVLVRTHAQGVDVKAALAALRVGSVELAQESVFRTTDAQEVERILAAVLEPERTDALRAALATQTLGLDARAIAALADDEATFTARIEAFAAYRATWLARGFGVMYRRLLTDERVAARMLARDDGERRMTNLLHLGEQLQGAAADGLAPDALLRWLSTRRREKSGDEALQLRLESDRNLVRIVTIHKAKGLEYPIVFCPFYWSRWYRRRDRADLREYHEHGRAILDFTPADKDDPASQSIDARIRFEDASEALRLIYVAVTRAVHRCYLIAGTYAVPPHGSQKESCHALGNWLVAGDGMTLDRWLDADRAPADIARAWRALAASAPTVALVPLPAAPGVPLADPARDPATIAALPPPARIAFGWRIGSFSALAQGAVSERAAADHDGRAVELDAAMPTHAAADPAAPAQERATIDPDDIARFPRGAAAGECLHAVFERIDFADPRGWRAIIAGALREFPPARGAAADPVRLAPMVERMLHDVVATPLPFGATLASVKPARRLAELKFTFPAPSVVPARLHDAVVAEGYAMPRLAPGTLAGYLNGYIDLVFEHDARYYVLDWKSNYLGSSSADYARRSIAAAMASHSYHLQQLVYALALDRYLRRRIRDYAPAAHFGGVLYLFVRGVRPAWRDDNGAPAGVYFDRPAPQALARIAAALGEREARFP